MRGSQPTLLEYRRKRRGLAVASTHRDTETQRHRDTETQRHRDTETQRHRDTETQRHRDTETQRHRDTETQRHRDTETQRHRDTETQRHRDTETQRHRDTETQRHRSERTALLDLATIISWYCRADRRSCHGTQRMAWPGLSPWCTRLNRRMLGDVSLSSNSPG